MLPYGRHVIEDDDIQAVIDVLKGDFLTTGPTVESFEKKLCEVTGVKHAVACSNGTTALHLACMAIGLQKGDCAIVPSLTFLATANAVRYCDADVIFSDVDPETGLMTKENFEDALVHADKEGLNVKAVLPVHLAGQPVDLAQIKSVAQKHDIRIIADSCHAIGGVYQNHPIGSCQYEDMATFSFHPVKTIAMGEGGAITTNNEEFAQIMREIRHHGMHKSKDMTPWAYEMKNLGYNYRVTDMQCALGLSQLQKIDHFIQKREFLTSLYDEKLQDLSPYIQPPKRVQQEKTGWHLYAMRIDFDKLGISRADFMNRLKDKNIGTQVHYIPVHTQPYYTDLYGAQTLSGAEEYYRKTLSFPLYPAMTEDDVNYIVKTLKDIIES